MAKNYVQDGDVLDYTPGTAVASGAMVVYGTKVGVALADIAANATGPLAVSDVFTLPKLSTDVIAVGAAVYWDNTNKRITVTSAGNTYAGYATTAAGNGVATCTVNINR